jgi:hypothetical protein
VAGVMSHGANDGYVGLLSSILKFFWSLSCLFSSFELKDSTTNRNRSAQFSQDQMLSSQLSG